MATRIAIGLGHRRPLIPITDGSRPLGKAAPDNRPEPPLTPRERRMADLFANATNGLPEEAITSAVYGNYEPYAIALRDAYLAIQPELAELILEEYGDAGTETAEQTKTEVTRLYRRMGLFRKETITPEYMVSSFRFDRTSPQARRYAQSTASRLVTNTTAEGVETLRTVVTEAYTIGRTPQTLAQNLYTALNNQDTFRPSTEGAQTLARFFGVQAHGLTTRYEQAVVNRATTLANQLAERGITGEKAAKEIQKKTQAYADKLRRARSKTIARTELLTANNAGKLASMKEAVDQGLASRENSRKQWRTGRFDVCPVCVNLHSSDPVPLDEDFAGRFAYPPAHPNCRCTIAFLPNIQHYQPGKPYGTNTPDDPLGIKPPDNGGVTSEFADKPLPGLESATPPTAPLQLAPQAPAVPVDIADAGISTTLRKEAEGIRNLTQDSQIRARRGRGPYPLDWEETREATKAMDALEEVGAKGEAAVQRVLDEMTPPGQKAQVAALKAEMAALRQAESAVLRNKVAKQIEIIAERIDEAAAVAQKEEGKTSLGKVSARLRKRALRPDLDLDTELLTSDDWKDLYGVAYGDDVAGELLEQKLSIYKWGSKASKGERYWATRDALKGSEKALEAAELEIKRIWDKQREVRTQILKLDKPNDPTQVREAVLRVLKANRPEYGTGDLTGIFGKQALSPSKGITKQTLPVALSQVAKSLPKIWVDALQKAYGGRMSFGVVGRGYWNYQRRQLMVSPGAWRTTLLHEFTHAVEDTSGGFASANALFYRRRAQSVLQSTGRLPTRQRIYSGRDEWYYDIGIGDEYAMKYYESGVGWELMTMGVQRIMMEGGWETMNAEWRRYVLGMLLSL